MRKKKVYWITSRITEEMRKKSEYLYKKDLSVIFFRNLEGLLAEYNRNRAGIIVISDDTNDTKKLIKEFATLPDMNGVRIILSIAIPDNETVITAWHAGLRDIIPMDLPIKTWLQRFLFSTSGQQQQFSLPNPRMTLRNISGLSLPARIVWISENRICIESKLAPPVGTKIKLSSSLFEAMGLRKLYALTEKVSQENLRYRFSHSMICSWSMPSDSSVCSVDALKKVASEDQGIACKVFIAAKSNKLRNFFLSRLKPPKFEVLTALTTAAIEQEPKYFGPNIVFIEEILCQIEKLNTFKIMASHIPSDVPIVIIGKKTPIKQLQPFFPNNKLILLPKLSEDMEGIIFERILKSQKWQLSEIDKKSVNISARSQLSHCEIHFSARLTQLNSEAVQLAIPFPISNYGMCRIESPFIKKILGRHCFAKITNAYRDPEEHFRFPWIINGAFVDIMAKERQGFSKSISAFFQNRLIPEEDKSKDNVITSEGSPQIQSQDIDTMSEILIEKPILSGPTDTKRISLSFKRLILSISFAAGCIAATIWMLLIGF